MKSNLSNEQLKEIVLHILKFGEGERDWWLKYLEINTGLDNLTDYIFYPYLIGLGEYPKVCVNLQTDVR